MIFKLTDEEIEEIIELYGGSKQVIQDVEYKLNYLEIINDLEDYNELVKIVISQYETIKSQIEAIKERNANPTESELSSRYMSLDEIIEYEINKKYEDCKNKSLI